MRKIAGSLLVLVSVAAVAAALVVHWVVAPNLAQLPGNTNTTRTYTGVAATLANPTIATGALFGPGLLRDVPIQVAHNTTVVGTRGHQALVNDTRVLTAPGFTLAALVNRFDVDRRTFLPGRAFENATPATGLTFNWPMGTKAQNYVGWVSDTGKTTVLRYITKVRHAGITTYVFKASTSFAPITDPQVLRVLPSSMPQSELSRLTPSLQFTHAQLMTLGATLAMAPATVPLAYDYRADSTFWVSPASGIVVDHQQREVRLLSLVVGGHHVPVVPVMDMTYRFTPATVAAASSEAKDDRARLTMLRSSLPDGLGAGGALLFVLGVVLMLWRRENAPDGTDGLVVPDHPRELTRA